MNRHGRGASPLGGKRAFYSRFAPGVKTSSQLNGDRDVNRIYDDDYRRAQQAKKEKFFIRPSRQRKMKNAKWFSIGMGIDLPFCLIILILLIVGTIMMFSASYAFSYYTVGDSYFYLKRQILFIVIGLAGMAVMSFFNYNKLHKIAPIGADPALGRGRRKTLDTAGHI